MTPDERARRAWRLPDRVKAQRTEALRRRFARALESTPEAGLDPPRGAPFRVPPAVAVVLTGIALTLVLITAIRWLA